MIFLRDDAGDLVARLPSQSAGIRRLSFMHNNDGAVVASSDSGNVYIWDIPSQSLTTTINVGSRYLV